MREKLNLPNILLGAIITTVITLVGTWAYGALTEKRPELQYSLTKGPPLPGSLANSGVYAVQMSNPGEKEAKNVRLEIRFIKGEIVEKGIEAPQAMEYTEKLLSKKSVYLLMVPILNQGERVTVSFFSRYMQQPVDPTIGLRGEGVNGVSAEEQLARSERTSNMLSLASLTATLLVTIVSVIYTVITYRRMRR